MRYDTDPLSGFEGNRRKYILARLSGLTTEQASKVATGDPGNAWHWPDYADVEAAADRIKADQVSNVLALMYDAVLKAIDVKIKGLSSESEVTSQRAATEILDRVLGKPVARVSDEGTNDKIDRYINLLRMVTANAEPMAPANEGEGTDLGSV